jgi:hypothetical protein
MLKKIKFLDQAYNNKTMENDFHICTGIPKLSNHKTKYLISDERVFWLAVFFQEQQVQI